MEKTPQELTHLANTYNISVKLKGDKPQKLDKIAVRAFSEQSAKLFTGEFDIDSFPEDIRDFGNCQAVMDLIQESLNQKQEISISDTGQVKFPLELKFGKRSSKKQIVFALKEVEFDQMQKLKVAIERHDKELKRQEILIEALRIQNEKLTEELNIVNPKYRKIIFQVDTATPYFNKFSIKDRTVGLNISNSNNYFPLFGKNLLENTQQLQFEILNQSTSNFMIGIASADLKNSTSIFSNAAAISLYSNQNAYICGNPEPVAFSSMMKTGSKIAMIVNLNKFTIEWQQIEPLFYSTPKITIPVRLRDKQLFPFIEVYDNTNNAAQIRLL